MEDIRRSLEDKEFKSIATDLVEGLEKESFINAVARELQPLCLPLLTKNTLKVINDTIGPFDFINLYLVDNDKATLSASLGELPDFFLEHATEIQKGEGVTWQIIGHGQFVHQPNVDFDPHMGRVGRELFGSYVGLPIKVDGKILGVLFVVSKDKYAFSKHTIKLLEFVVDQINYHYKNAIYIAGIEKRLAELEKKWQT